MNYFEFGDSDVLGRVIRSTAEGLEYDRKVMRHVYLGQPLDIASLPDFCTDSQPDCGPFPVPQTFQSKPVGTPIVRSGLAVR
jgi:hypothetical protein